MLQSLSSHTGLVYSVRQRRWRSVGAFYFRTRISHPQEHSVTNEARARNCHRLGSQILAKTYVRILFCRDFPGTFRTFPPSVAQRPDSPWKYFHAYHLSQRLACESTILAHRRYSPVHLNLSPNTCQFKSRSMCFPNRIGTKNRTTRVSTCPLVLAFLGLYGNYTANIGLVGWIIVLY